MNEQARQIVEQVRNRIVGVGWFQGGAMPPEWIEDWDTWADPRLTGCPMCVWATFNRVIAVSGVENSTASHEAYKAINRALDLDMIEFNDTPGVTADEIVQRLDKVLA